MAKDEGGSLQMASSQHLGRHVVSVLATEVDGQTRLSLVQTRWGSKADAMKRRAGLVVGYRHEPLLYNESAVFRRRALGLVDSLRLNKRER
jgi:hypothetical protein